MLKLSIRFIFASIFITTTCFASAKVTFYPQGYIRHLSQIQAVFADDMVALGEAGSLQPFDRDCTLSGNEHWIDSKTWVLDLAEPLKGGVKCRFKLKKNLLNIKGKKIEGSQEFLFHTGGPTIQSIYPNAVWDKIQEDQLFLLTLDTEPDPESVEKNIYFSVEGINEKIPVKILVGSEKDDALKYARSKENPKNILALTAKRNFPSSASVMLVFGKEVKALANNESNEDDQSQKMQVRPDFSSQMVCLKENAEALCCPLGDIRLKFTSPLRKDTAEKISLLNAEGKPMPFDRLNEDVDGEISEILFKSPFVAHAKYTLSIPKDLTDVFGRALVDEKKFPMEVAFDEQPTLAKFPASFGILEASSPILPLTIRGLEENIKLYGEGFSPTLQGQAKQFKGSTLKVDPAQENVMNWLGRLQNSNREISIFSGIADTVRTLNETQFNALTAEEKKPSSKLPLQTFAIHKEEDGKKGIANVIGIPFEKPGFYVVEVESLNLGKALLGKNDPMYVSTSVLVTNMAVHLKHSPTNSLVWVTSLTDGAPVKNATVALLDCENKPLFTGKTNQDGLYQGTGIPPEAFKCSRDNFRNDLLVTATLEKDFSFTSTSWKEGIEPWRFNVTQSWDTQESIAHSVFSRNLLRAGEKLQMKHLLRKKSTEGLSLVANKDLPQKLLIKHRGSGKKFFIPLDWAKGSPGYCESEWEIPKNAELGTYDTYLVTDSKSAEKNSTDEEQTEDNPQQLEMGSFRVEEFRVPLMKGQIQVPKDPVIFGEPVHLELGVQYLNGGGASHLNGTLRWGNSNFGSGLYFANYADYRFANGVITEGITDRGFGLERYSYSYASDVDDDQVSTSEEAPSESNKKKNRKSLRFSLNEHGSTSSELTYSTKQPGYFSLQAEMEFMDPNGEIQTISQNIPIYPASKLIGIKINTSYPARGQSIKLETVALSPKGEATQGAEVTITAFTKKLVSHRKKILGGLYAYEHQEMIVALGKICEGRSDAKGFFQCSHTPTTQETNVVFLATTRDDKNRESSAYNSVWLSNGREHWFQVSDSDRMDLVPEKKQYAVGETAKIQVQMPFREAQALVTIEREGILESTVVHLLGTNPYVEIPIKKAHAPNMFVSVLAVRGRQNDVQPTAMVDLGRPSYKLGIIELKVGLSENTLKVTASTDKKVYQVREQVKVDFKVEPPKGQKLAPHSEIAVAVVDEGLLELMPNPSFDALEKFMQPHTYRVETATAQMHIVGKRHFGLKAQPTGGGGGHLPTRELFDTLLFWKGTIPLDADGKAHIDFPLQDSLTGYRILVLATSGTDLFGKGETSLGTTQDFMTFAGIPPVARSGDELDCLFTVRNTTDATRSISIQGTMQAIQEKDTQPLAKQSITLLPKESKEVNWKVKIPSTPTALTYEVTTADEKSQKPLDRLKVKQKTIALTPIRVQQTKFIPSENAQRYPVALPEGALSTEGGIELSFSESLLGNTEEVQSYMANYAFGCLEQKVSKAVVADDKTAWQKIMREIPQYTDQDHLLKYFPRMNEGSDALTSYVLTVSSNAQFTLPEEVKKDLLEGLKAFVSGSLRREAKNNRVDLLLRKIAALEAIAEHNPKMITDKLLSNLSSQDPKSWPLVTQIQWWKVWEKLSTHPQQKARKQEVADLIRQQIIHQGSYLQFEPANNPSFYELMNSSDATTLKAILAFCEDPTWKDDLPLLLQGAMSSQVLGHWGLTTTNAWGMLAVRKFSAHFEKTPLKGQTRIKLQEIQKAFQWPQDKDQVFKLPWPQTLSDLELQQQGERLPWTRLTFKAAIPLKAPKYAGLDIKKTFYRLEDTDPLPEHSLELNTGDLVRVRWEINSPHELTWVVLEDPIPTGAVVLGSKLGRSSELLNDEDKKAWAPEPAFEERTFTHYRVYYQYLAPASKWEIEYTLRLNASGAFQVPASRMEAMYHPEIFAEVPNPTWQIRKN